LFSDRLLLSSLSVLAVEEIFKDLVALLVKLLLDELFEGLSWKSFVLVLLFSSLFLVLLPISLLSVLPLSFAWSRIFTIIRRGTIAY